MLKPKPDFISINITDKCCLRCVMCNEWKSTKKDLSADEWKKIIDEANELGIKRIFFYGGEPLMRKDLFELIRYSNSLGMRVNTITNGFLMDEQKLQEFLKCDVESVTLSIDAVGDEYDRIRGVKGAYEHALKACELFKILKEKKGVKIYVNFLVMKDTLDTFKDVKEIIEKYGFSLALCLLDYTPEFLNIDENRTLLWIKKEEDFNKLRTIQESLYSMKKKNPDSVSVSYADIDYVSDYFKDPLQKRIPCIVSNTRIFIDSIGDVYGGCWSMGAFGNIHNEQLKKIINSDKYIKTHRKMFYKNCPGCSCGSPANVRYYFPNVFKNILLKFFKG
ncbi:radical SAM protein [bacterium]